MRSKISKKVAAALTIVMTSMSFLDGCGGEVTPAVSDEAQVSEAAEQSKEPVSVAEVYQQITDAVTLYSPVCMDDEFIENYYGIDASKLEEYIFSMSEDAAQAETVIVMKAKDEADVEELAACLQVVVDEKKNEMENYLPEQFAIVEQSKVRTKGAYVWLVISEQEKAIQDIIEGSLL